MEKIFEGCLFGAVALPLTFVYTHILTRIRNILIIPPPIKQNNMEILTINNEEFIQGFTQDGEIIPIDIVSDVTGLTCEEIRKTCKKAIVELENNGDETK